MAPQTRSLEGSTRRKVDRMLRKGAEPDEVAKMLMNKGWEPGEAEATAEREDRRFQDVVRDNAMGKTHAPRGTAARTGGGVLAIILAVWVVFKGLKILFRLME